MNTRTMIAFGLAALILTAGSSYWLGSRSHAPSAAPTTASAEPAKRKLLYYRNPMGLPDTSPTPKKDQMGMDYIAVYAGEEEPAGSNQIRISTEKVQKLGVKTETVALRALERKVRAAGRIEADERRVVSIAPKFEGYVERLHVAASGQPVSKGQALFEVYSPDLVTAQREYSIAAEGARALKEAGGEASIGMQRLAEASQARLKNWDISPGQIQALAKSGNARHTLTFSSPVTGIVSEKKAVQGMRFMPGDVLFQIADLSSVWVLADVFEQDIALVKTGSTASVRLNAYPDKTFSGRIAYVYPTMKTETRTIPVRIELPNPNGLLKPGMFAQVELATGGKEPVLTVPLSAVIDSGSRQTVLVQLAEGKFEPREVRLGARSDSYVEVLQGVRAGEAVVVAANFLIDAESNLKAALGGFTPAPKATVGHQAEGKVESIDAKAGTVSITHGPVASLKWPAMTMDFIPANPALINELKPGASIAFEFVERGPGEWVITSIKATAGH